MKVALTGASGYLGGSLVEAFRRHGHEVLCLSRRPCDDNWLRYALEDDPEQLPWDGVEILVHAAYDFQPLGWQAVFERNVEPSIALFKSAVRAGVGKLIFISSMSSFDGCRSNYGRAKRLIEKEVLDLGATVVRPGLVWGEDSGGVMGALERAVCRFPLLPFPSCGTAGKQFLIHELDLGKALVAIAENPPSADGAVKSVACPTSLSIQSILKVIASRAGLRRTFLPVPWQCFMAGLRVAEMCRIDVPFRSDSLLGLVRGNSRPVIDAPPEGGLYRSFETV